MGILLTCPQVGTHVEHRLLFWEIKLAKHPCEFRQEGLFAVGIIIEAAPHLLPDLLPRRPVEILVIAVLAIVCLALDRYFLLDRRVH